MVVRTYLSLEEWCQVTKGVSHQPIMIKEYNPNGIYNVNFVDEVE